MIFEGQFIIKVNSKVGYVTKFLQSNTRPAVIHMVLIGLVNYMPAIWDQAYQTIIAYLNILFPERAFFNCS